jgi:transposase-like protein
MKLLEDFLMARAAKEGDDHAICARLGVARASIYAWKAQLERGEELTDTMRGPRPEPKEAEPVAAKKKHSGSRKGVPNTPHHVRARVAQEVIASGETFKAAAPRYGIHPSGLSQWVKDYKAGKFGKAGKTPNAHGKPDQVVMFEDAESSMAAKKKSHEPATLTRVVESDVAVLQSQLAIALADNKRLRAKIQKLVGMVADDD